MDFLKILQTSPSFGRSGYRPEPYLRLVLAEAASYGMPPQVVATLDDIAAMMGFYEPLPDGQAHWMGSTVMPNWQYDRRASSVERITDVEALALKQRAMIAFGHMPPGHLCGTAEIVCAMGNLTENSIPKPFFEVFQWATVDVQATLTDKTPAEIRQERNWPEILDSDVIRPGGRLNATYQQIATLIRREVIAAMRENPRAHRKLLKPFASDMLELNQKLIAEAKAEGTPAVIEPLERTTGAIYQMFPDLKAEKAGEGT